MSDQQTLSSLEEFLSEKEARYKGVINEAKSGNIGYARKALVFLGDVLTLHDQWSDVEKVAAFRIIKDCLTEPAVGCGEEPGQYWTRIDGSRQRIDELTQEILTHDPTAGNLAQAADTYFREIIPRDILGE